VIEPRRGRGLLGVFRDGYLAEAIRQRELLGFLIWRDVKVKYKMAALGIAWAVLTPLMSTLIYGIAGMLFGFGERTTAPYLLYMAAGMTPWVFLQKSVSEGGMSLVFHQQLLSKIYLPRLYVPFASCGTALVDLSIAMGVALGFGVGFAIAGMWVPTIDLLAVIPMLLLTAILGVGTATLLSGLTVLYRDLRFLIPTFTQFGLWLSGVVFPTSILGRYEWILAFNPFAGVVSGWRSAICGEPWQPILLLGSLVLSPIILWVGIAYFRRVERRFADIA
jgi:lipopolysaccharide transport system permease protein